jgi:hypothetical protein
MRSIFSFQFYAITNELLELGMWKYGIKNDHNHTYKLCVCLQVNNYKYGSGVKLWLYVNNLYLQLQAVKILT